MAQRPVKRFRDDEQHDAGSKEARIGALEELNALRRSIQARIGTYPGDPVAEVRAERERQQDAVLNPIRHK